MKRDEFYAETARMVLNLMKDKGTGWVKPWARAASFMNGVSGHQYRGLNTLLLALASAERGWSDPRFVGFRQAAELAGGKQGLKGKKGVRIFAPMTRKVTEDDGTERVLTSGMRATTIFNVADVEGADAGKLKPLPCATERDPVARNEHAEAVIVGSGADIEHRGDAACYIPAQDRILLPPLTSWIGTDTATPTQAYYSTAFHELGHWTGAAKRLNRLKGISKIDAAYAFEELVAELTAVFLSRHTGVLLEPTVDNARYLNAWMQRLAKGADGTDFLLRASGKAQTAADFILGRLETRRPARSCGDDDFDVIDDERAAA